MKQLILSIFIIGLSQITSVQVAGASKNNCHSIYADGELRLNIDIALKDKKSIPDFFKLFQEDQNIKNTPGLKSKGNLITSFYLKALC